MLPVSRTRRISLIAAEALTSKRAAACLAELPASTARTNRLRRSFDKGAVITSLADQRQPRIRTPESVQGGNALGGDDPERLCDPACQRWSFRPRGYRS